MAASTEMAKLKQELTGGTVLKKGPVHGDTWIHFAISSVSAKRQKCDLAPARVSMGQAYHMADEKLGGGYPVWHDDRLLPVLASPPLASLPGKPWPVSKGDGAGSVTKLGQTKPEKYRAVISTGPAACRPTAEPVKSGPLGVGGPLPLVEMTSIGSAGLLAELQEGAWGKGCRKPQGASGSSSSSCCRPSASFPRVSRSPGRLSSFGSKPRSKTTPRHCPSRSLFCCVIPTPG